jgi:hypothetical protein
VARSAGLALLLAGLALGPGLWIAGRYFSGQPVADQLLHFAAGPDGRAVAEARFSLPASALPASVVVQATASHGPAVRPADLSGDHWDARLAKDGRTVREQTLHLQSHTLEATPALVFKEVLPIDAAQGGGDYSLRIALPVEPRLTLESARVTVRANVRVASPVWLAAGLALAAAGAVLLVLR